MDGILFATNHFEENKDLLNKIVEMAKLFSATIHVAVFTEKHKIEADSYIYNSNQLDKYINFLKKTFPGVAFKGELLEGNEFEETVEKYDEKNEVDIIAMIMYPKNFINRLLKRSATRKMAYHSRIPVLAVLAK